MRKAEWNSLVTSYPLSEVEVFEREEAVGAAGSVGEGV
jgi:hypothetical protein